jgi:hypothetical protein
LQLNASAMGESELMQLLKDKDGALLAMTESARALERAVAEAKVTRLTPYTMFQFQFHNNEHVVIVSRKHYDA